VHGAFAGLPPPSEVVAEAGVVVTTRVAASVFAPQYHPVDAGTGQFLLEVWEQRLQFLRSGVVDRRLFMEHGCQLFVIHVQQGFRADLHGLDLVQISLHSIAGSPYGRGYP